MQRVNDDVLSELANQALYHQRTAQIGRHFASDVHLRVSSDTFLNLFEEGALTRSDTGMWEYCGALVWVATV